MIPLSIRFLRKIEVDQHGCWIWTAAHSPAGYGQIKVDGRLQMAHRVAYEHLVGPIPEGLHIDHLCRVRACVNPEHLEPVTPGENARRSPIVITSINALLTHCRRGHRFTTENTYRWRGRRCCRACANRRRAESRRRLEQAEAS